MTQEEFEEKLAKLVYRFVNNNEDEDLEEGVDLDLSSHISMKKLI